MKYILVLLLLISVVFGLVFSVEAAEDGLVVYYDFGSNTAGIAKDLSGNGNDGKIFGAVWSKLNGSEALKFDGKGDYIELANKNVVDITGDFTISTWVKFAPGLFPTNDSNFTIISDEDFSKSGIIVRIEGSTGQLYYRASQDKKYKSIQSRMPLENGTFYHIVVIKQGGEVRFIIDGKPDTSGSVDLPVAPTESFKISESGQSFDGYVVNMRIYNRALTTGEVTNQYIENAKRLGKDTSWIGAITVKPYVYYDKKEILIQSDLTGVLPLLSDEKLAVKVSDSSRKVVKSIDISDKIAANGKSDYMLDMSCLNKGKYNATVVVGTKNKIRSKAGFVFEYPLPALVVPSPEKKAVKALLKPVSAPSFDLNVASDGGTTVKTNYGKGAIEYKVESLYSYPNGGNNGLFNNSSNETAWNVQVNKINLNKFSIVGEGNYYRVSREINKLANRIIFKDTITNKSSDAIGIIFSNKVEQISGSDGFLMGGYMAGNPMSVEVSNVDIKTNPTVFVKAKPEQGGGGFGIIASDDLFVLQSLGSYTGRGGSIGSNTFALDSGKSYTFEWALYPTKSGDYYDFINEVRRDENRNTVTVEGGFAFIGTSFYSSVMPTKEFVEYRNLKYFTLPSLGHIPDDPQISVEGIEFKDFPKLSQSIKDQFAAAKKLYPDMEFSFHIAHNLYATNTPDKIYPDSRVINADGTQNIYPYSYETYGYFSKERIDANWRWWLYYPTKENSFGKAMLDSVDTMMDEMGATGGFMDGFFWDYGTRYTYDRWDGLTAEIDPVTKTIKRKMADALYLSQPLLVEYVRKIRSKGGVVIANNCYATRTILNEYMIHDKELTEGPYLHLHPTTCCLGSASYSTEADLWQDIINKLKWGMIYFYYGEKDLVAHPSAPAQMYPITIEELHSGYVKGKERLITIHSGDYGWLDNNQLHYSYKYDGRGYPVLNNFLTTVDKSGTRTKIELEPNEMAIVKRIPVSLDTVKKINVFCSQYDAKGINIVLNGTGQAKLTVLSGDFVVSPDTAYKVIIAGKSLDIMSNSSGKLVIPVKLNGRTLVVVTN